MLLVIDANIIISAILKEGYTRKIILEDNFELISPSYVLSEIMKYKNEMCRRLAVSSQNFDFLLDKIFNHIKIINKIHYAKFINYSCSLIEDSGDVPFLALAIAFNAPIWTDDYHFKKQKKVNIFTTKEIIGLLEN